MTEDKNKDIAAIEYNFLNLPRTVTKTNGDQITYAYDATGRKLYQTVTGTQNKTSDYLGEFFYENDTLKFINHEEGRVVPPPAGSGVGNEYQYHLKDHLGNIRLTFTAKQEADSATATMETANVAEEQGEFLYYEEAVKINSTLFDHTNAGGTYYAARLNGSTNEQYGLAKSLSVMPGDTVRAEVYAKYLDPDNNNWTQALSDLISAIAGGTAPAGTFVDGGATGSTGGTTPSFISLLNKSGETGTTPKAYLNYLVFDRDYNFLNGGFVRMTEAAEEAGQDVAHEKLSSEFVVTEPGYVYIYISNDNAALGGAQIETYWDDFSVELVKSPVVQEEDYYPFGLTFNSYSRENATPQDFKYNGKELQDELDLEWYDYQARQYDPAIARWMAVDPLADKMRRHSPYNYGFDNPLRFIDPDGMGPTDVILGGTEKQKAFEQLQASVKGELNLSMNSKGLVTYTKANPDSELSGDAQQLATAIDDHSVQVQVNASTENTVPNGNPILGGAFLGAQNLKNAKGETVTVARQQINTNHTEAIDSYYEKPGSTTLHEVTESYQGAKMVQERGVNSGPQSSDPNSVYRAAHEAATDPPTINARHYDVHGNVVSPNAWDIVRSVFYVKSEGKPEKIILQLPLKK